MYGLRIAVGRWSLKQCPILRLQPTAYTKYVPRFCYATISGGCCYPLHHLSTGANARTKGGEHQGRLACDSLIAGGYWSPLHACLTAFLFRAENTALARVSELSFSTIETCPRIQRSWGIPQGTFLWSSRTNPVLGRWVATRGHSVFGRNALVAARSLLRVDSSWLRPVHCGWEVD
jgi:hypothetical protein